VVGVACMFVVRKKQDGNASASVIWFGIDQRTTILRQLVGRRVMGERTNQRCAKTERRKEAEPKSERPRNYSARGS